MKKNPPTADFQSGTRSCHSELSFFVPYLTVDLCLVQGFNALKHLLDPSSSNPHSPAPMWLMSVVKLGVEPSPALKLRTQAVMRAAL